MTGAAVQAEGLRKSYGDVEAVRGVDLAIPRGECYGFLGPNGAGKTTLMKMVYCRQPPGAGRLAVLGFDAGRDAARIKLAIGVVAQETALDPELTVLENLVQYARYFGLSGADALARSRELLAFVRLEGRGPSRVDELSGGMKRRLMLARALVNRPSLLVLDEPTTGLDPQARLSVWDRLFALRREGVTIVVTTHYMEEAARLCNRLAIMHRGILLREGAPDRLVREGVEAQVLEFPAESALAEAAGSALNGIAGHVQYQGGMLSCYGPDADAMLGRLAEAGTRPTSHRVRPANLEDLFLRLTGLELRE